MKNLNVLILGVFAAIVLAGISSCGGGDDPINDVTPTPKTVKVESVSLSKTTLSIEEGGEQTITVTVSPSNATNKKYTLTSSDPNILTVDENGKVKALKSGEATITVTSTDGNKTASCKVTVTPKVIPIESINLENTELSLEEGSDFTLTYTITPDNATFKSIIWSTSDSTIVAIDEKGKLTAVGVGNATIKASTEDGSKTATCEIIVTPKVIHVENISLDQAELYLVEGREATITYSLTPDDATDKSIIWSSSDSSIVAVDENGKLSAVASGDVTITATTADGSKTATCKVNVSKIIEFIDEGAKWWCMQFDTNEDGELTMGEAAAVEELPSYAFSYKNKYKENEDRPEITSFNEFQFFTSLKELGASAFESSGIEEICLPDNITYIGHDAFHYCRKLSNINIPNSVTTIEQGAFDDCGLININIPNSVTTIGMRVFAENRSLISVKIPNSVTTIGMRAFENCRSLSNINIPNSVTTIGYGAFSYCDIKDLVIPNSVTTIGDYAFAYNYDLMKITILSKNPPKISDGYGLMNVFYKKDYHLREAFTIFVPSESVELYKNDPLWKIYGDRIKAIP